jgi:hypothetical protein
MSIVGLSCRPPDMRARRTRVALLRLRLTRAPLGRLGSFNLTCWVLGALFGSAVVQAQTTPEYPEDSHPVTYLLLGGTIAYPQWLTADVGFLVGRGRRLSGFSGEARGVMGGVEPGIGGLKCSLGYAALQPYDAGIGGIWVRGSYLRTWGPQAGVSRNANYAGVEGIYHFTWFKAQLGLLRRTGGSPSRRWLVTGGVGVTLDYF